MRRAIAYLGILVVLAACSLGEALRDYGSPVDLTPQTLAGTWRSGSNPRLLTFAEDGAFAATDLPSEIFDDVLPQSFDPLHDRVDGAGTWELKAGSGGKRSTVVLAFDKLAGADIRYGGLELSATQYDDRPVWLVFYYVGDGGNETTSYEKCAADCPAPQGTKR